MLADVFKRELENVRLFFNRSTKPLTEDDSLFKPQDEMYTVAQQVAHAAHTVEGFSNNAFTETGPEWDENAMEDHNNRVMTVTSLTAARKWFNESIDRAIENFGKRSDEELLALLPETSLLGPFPRFTCLYGIQDHTAHHRGALTVYVRALGKTPPIPYMPDEA
ncbi:DinB family protein [bacterium]|nr:DinB family protein [bacterium]